MHDKLKLLLDKIGLESEFYSYFNNGKLEKVILNKQEKKSCFVISVDNTLPLQVFLSLKEKIVPSFSNDSIKEVLVRLNVKNINYDLLEEYYKQIINSIPGIAIKIFIDNKIYYDDGIKIEVINIAEENKELTLSYGVRKAPTLLVPNGDKFDCYDNVSLIKRYIEENAQ